MSRSFPKHIVSISDEGGKGKEADKRTDIVLPLEQDSDVTSTGEHGVH